MTNSEEKPLKALCKIGLNAGDKGYWSNEDIMLLLHQLHKEQIGLTKHQPQHIKFVIEEIT